MKITVTEVSLLYKELFNILRKMFTSELKNGLKERQKWSVNMRKIFISLAIK